MVRTRGPWRCVFSTGKQASKGHRSLGAAGASLSKANEVRQGCVDLVNGDRVDVGIGKKGGEVISALSTPSGGAVKNDHNEGTTAKDRDPAAKRRALSGKIDPELDETSHGAGGEDPESNEADGGGADLPLEGEVGLIYLNPTTGETALEPPPEFVARAEEAEVAGEYLIFIPSRGFFVAAKHAQPVTAAASCATPSMTIEASRKGVFEGTDADRGGVLRAGQGRALATPDPRGSAGPLETDGGGGTDAWDRLSVTSQQGTPLSQTPGVRRTGARSATVTRDFEQRGPTKTSNPETSVASLTIDLSQGESRKLSPMIVAEKDIEGEGVGADEAGGFAETGGTERTGTGEAWGTWACAVCTLENKERARRCAVCETPKAKPSGSKVRPGGVLEGVVWQSVEIVILAALLIIVITRRPFLILLVRHQSVRAEALFSSDLTGLTRLSCDPVALSVERIKAPTAESAKQRRQGATTEHYHLLRREATGGNLQQR